MATQPLFDPTRFDPGRVVLPDIELVRGLGKATELRHLWQAPFTLQPNVVAAIRREAEIARGMLDSEPALAPGVAEEAADTVAVAFVTSESDQILDDAERAVLAALRAFDIWPGEAISWPAIRDAALQRGFEGERLDAASHSLRRKDLIRDLDEDRITLTRPGFLAAPQAA